MQPIARRPHLPVEYGVPTGADAPLPWSHVTARLATARHYWLSTLSPDGTPHTRPIGGMWLDDQLYFGGSANSRWFRNLGYNPHMCVNLSEEGDQAVILHGTAHPLRPDRALAIRLVEASNAKYGYGQKAEDYEGQTVFVFRPSVAFAWTALNKDRASWQFS